MASGLRTGTNVKVLPMAQRAGARRSKPISSAVSPMAAAIASRLAATPAGLGNSGSRKRAWPWSAPAGAAVQWTGPIFSSSTILPESPRPFSASSSAVPTVGWPAKGNSTAGVKIRTRTVPPATDLSTNTVSGWPNSRAIVCIRESSSESASNTTASGLPVNRRSVNTSRVANDSFIGSTRPHPHERLAVTFGDELVVLVIGAVQELDDSGARPRIRFALADNLGGDVHGIAFEQRMREFHIGHAEIGDGGAHRHVGDLDADHQPECEQRVHQRLAPFGLLFAEVAIDVEGLRIEGHVGEQHVVHLRHGAAQRMLVDVPDHEVVEIDTAARVATDERFGLLGHGAVSRTRIRRYSVNVPFTIMVNS